MIGNEHHKKKKIEFNTMLGTLKFAIHHLGRKLEPIIEFKFLT